MAASLPPVTSSTPATPSGSNPDVESNPTMTPFTGAPAATSPAKSGSLPAPEGGSMETPTVEAPVEKATSSKSKRRRDRRSKPKPKPKKKHTAQCVGYYVDALDKKMLWGEARIIQCNLTTQKIKVHFVGWSKNYDLWTDAMSITAHGRYAPRTKDETVKSWDGDMHLFEDMLGTIEEATFTPIPVPDNEPKATSSRSSAKKKTSDKKNISSEKLTANVKASSAPQPKRSHAIRKTTADDEGKASSKSVSIAKAAESTGIGRSSKRQRREVQQPATSSAPTRAKARPSKKKRALSPDQLPMFRDLELDDGTVLDFFGATQGSAGRT